MRLTSLLPVILTSSLLLSACQNTTSQNEVLLVSGEACTIPGDLSPARPYRVPSEDVVDDVPTAFNMLAISWSPQACRSGKDYPDERYQCAQNQFGLTLHGLWPNGAQGRHPRYCEAPGPAISTKTLRENFCMMPSPSLQQHEWAAHGTCGWDNPEAYFAQSAALWNDLKKPDLEAIPANRMTAGAIRDAFVAANPAMPRNSIFVATTDGWFREVRLCYSRSFRSMACPSGLGAKDSERLKLAPRGNSQTRS